MLNIRRIFGYTKQVKHKAMKTNIIVYYASETNKIKGYTNGKVYGGFIYINVLDEETMTIDFKHSVKVPYDTTKLFNATKSTELYNAKNETSKLPTNVTDWMKLMEKTER